jgi:O-antigen ligase
MHPLSQNRSSSPSNGAWRARVRPRAATALPAAGGPADGSLRAATIGTAADSASSPIDRRLLYLLCAWILALCFDYRVLPLLRLELGVSITPDRLVLAALIATFIATKAWRTGDVKRPLAGKAVGRFAWLFAGIAVTSWVIVAPDTRNTSYGNLTWIMNLMVFPALAFHIASRLQYTRAMLMRLFWFLAIIGAYLACTAIAEHYERLWPLVFPRYILDPSVGIHWGRSRGPFVDTISNGGMLIAAFLAFTFVATSLTGVKRLIALGFTLLIVPAVYFTETRGVWLGWAAATATLVVFGKELRRPALLVAGALLIAFVVGIGSKFSLNESTLFSRRQNTVDYRLNNYQIAWDAFKANPAFGVGYGNFYGVWRNYADQNTREGRQGLADGNHSTILGILAELGLAGALPYVALIGFGALLCLSGQRRLKRQNLPFERRIAVMALGMLQAFVLLGLTNDLKAMPTINIVALTFLGVVTSLLSVRPVTRDAAAARHPQSKAVPARHARIRPSFAARAVR